jgi:hypothetical protein
MPEEIVKRSRPRRRGEAGEWALLFVFVILLLAAFLKHYLTQGN